MLGTIPLAAFVFGVVWWGMRKETNLPRLGGTKLFLLFAGIWVTTVTVGTGMYLTLSIAGVTNAKDYAVPFGLFSGIVGYLVGKQVADRMRKPK